MKIAVMGSGGVGGYYGGLLAQAGHDVTFIARGAHLVALRENGLQVKSVHGDFTEGRTGDAGFAQVHVARLDSQEGTLVADEALEAGGTGLRGAVQQQRVAAGFQERRVGVLGCSNAAASRASAKNISTYELSDANSGRILFSATYFSNPSMP